jgi:hypothetical protein
MALIYQTFAPYINREFDKLSAHGIALLRPTTSAKGRDIEQTILKWSKSQLAQSGGSSQQTINWDQTKGCGVIVKEDTPDPLNLLRYYRSQRDLHSGSSYPQAQDCKSIKQLASACEQGTIWPSDSWNQEAVEKEEKLFWQSMDDPTVPRHYEQERNRTSSSGNDYG